MPSPLCPECVCYCFVLVMISVENAIIFGATIEFYIVCLHKFCTHMQRESEKERERERTNKGYVSWQSCSDTLSYPLRCVTVGLFWPDAQEVILKPLVLEITAWLSDTVFVDGGSLTGLNSTN